jgi:hypothetical protein
MLVQDVTYVARGARHGFLGEQSVRYAGDARINRKHLLKNVKYLTRGQEHLWMVRSLNEF